MVRWSNGITRLILKQFEGKCRLEFLNSSGKVLAKSVVEMRLNKGTLSAKEEVTFVPIESGTCINIKVRRGRHWMLVAFRAEFYQEMVTIRDIGISW